MPAVNSVLHLEMCVLVASFTVLFIRPQLFDSGSGGLRIAVCIPRGAKKKRGKKTFRKNDAMPLQWEWTESSACLTTDVLLQGHSTIIIVKLSG